MGRLKENCHKKNTYARALSDDYKANNEKKKQRHRKVLPEFDKLFLKKINDSLLFSFQNSLTDSHLNYVESIRESSEVNCTNKSSSHSLFTSGNDTFDKLTKGISNLQIYLGDSQKTTKQQANKERSNFEKLLNNSSHSSPSLKEYSSYNLSGGHLFSSPKVVSKKEGKSNVKKNKLKPKAKSVITKAYKHDECKRGEKYLENVILPTVKVNKVQEFSDDGEVSNSSIKNIEIDNEVVFPSNTFQGDIDYGRLSIIGAKTSTPIVEERSSDRYVTRRGKGNVNPEFSPVECDESFNNFEISIEENLSPEFVSCTSNLKLNNLDSTDNKKIQNSNENDCKSLCQNSDTPSYRSVQSFERKFPKCKINLICPRENGKINKNHSSIIVSDCSDRFHACRSSTHSFTLPLSTQRYSTSGLCMRRNILNNYCNNRKRKFVSRKLGSYMCTSAISKDSMNSFVDNKTSSDLFKNSISLTSDAKFNSKSLYYLSSNLETASESSLRIKCGKGWRRSIRDSWKKHQILCDISKFEDGGRISLDKSSVLLFDDTGPQTKISCDDVIYKSFHERILSLCRQSTEVPITECFHNEMLLNCKKIGEGVYGEVFMTDCKETTLLQDRRVLKIMPIEGSFAVNGEPQKSFEEISSEIIVSMELSKLCNFSNDNSCSSYAFVHRSWCVFGSYPPKLVELWDKYHDEKESENDRPDIFPEKQLYIILEFGYGGQDMESFVFNNALQAYTTFVQVALGLAVAEEVFEFEHRDLHWGNVLITPISDANLDYKFKGQSYKIKSNGVKATIIDFTLSRMKLGGIVYYNDLSKDPSLFTAEGDYQFQVYRLMKDANSDHWNDFVPVTNIYWLHYIILKMINDCYYKNKSTKVHKMGLKKLKEVEENLLQYTSASEFVAILKELS